MKLLVNIFKPLSLSLLFSAPMLFLLSCGGGGGGGGGGVITTTITIVVTTGTTSTMIASVPFISTTTVSITAPATADPAIVPTNEYNQNYGLGNINANAAYQRGYYGQGVTVGVVDTGIHISHADLAANLVAGRRSDSTGNLYSNVNDADGHGTFVAGVIGGVKDGERFHGVAPSVAIMPLQIGDTFTSPILITVPGIITLDYGEGARLRGQTAPIYHYAATSGVHVLNHSYGYTDFIPGTYQGNTVVLLVPPTEQLINAQGYSGFYQNLFADIRATMGDADMLMVWASGNSGWHSGGGIAGSVIVIEVDPFVATRVSPGEAVQNFQTLDGLSFSNLSVDLNDPGGFALAPLYEPELTDRWLVAAAVNSLSVMASFSNGCGEKSRYWCLAAPGVDINSATNTGDTATEVGNGTSFAAPHVSGALALLKSRLPFMPMRVARVVLLETATDLGAVGVDAVYGHGHLDVEAAITAVGAFTVYGYGNVVLTMTTGLTVTTGFTATVTATAGAGAGGGGSSVTPPITVTKAITATATAAAFSQSGINLPAHYADFAARLAEVSVAVKYLDKYYYNTSLGDFIQLQVSQQNIHLGNAAQGVWGQSQQAIDLGGNLFALTGEAGDIQGASFRLDSFQFNYHLDSQPPLPLWESPLAHVAKPFFAVDGQDVQARWQVGEWETFAVVGLNEDGKGDYEKTGVRWQPQIGGLHWLAEYSHVEEEEKLLGGDLSVWGWQGGAATEQGRLGVHGDINDRWQGFAVYEHGVTRAHNASTGLINGISAIETGAWRLGIRARTLFRGNDVMGFAVSRKNNQDKGFISFRHHLAGETAFIEDLQQYLPVGTDEVIDRVDISSKEIHIFAWHYGFEPADSTRISFGLEHETGQGETVASFVADWDL